MRIEASAHRDGQDALLTIREKKVLKLAGEANTNKEIAAVLGISPATVKRHMENILRKLGLTNRVEATVYALKMDACPLGSRPRNCPLAVWKMANRQKVPMGHPANRQGIVKMV